MERADWTRLRATGGLVALFLAFAAPWGAGRSVGAQAPAQLGFLAYLPLVQAPLPTAVSATDGMALVRVPAGAFLMGSAGSRPDEYSDEQPQHRVYLDAYWIDRTEVTNAMFERFVDATGYRTDAERKGSRQV